jgi:hypothetical protein
MRIEITICSVDAGLYDFNVFDQDGSRYARISALPWEEVLDELDNYEAQQPSLVYPNGETYRYDDQRRADMHPAAPESDDPRARCGDCNERWSHWTHAGMGTDTRYWPE